MCIFTPSILVNYFAKGKSAEPLDRGSLHLPQQSIHVWSSVTLKPIQGDLDILCSRPLSLPLAKTTILSVLQCLTLEGYVNHCVNRQTPAQSVYDTTAAEELSPQLVAL
jgi:hypothetical protein